MEVKIQLIMAAAEEVQGVSDKNQIATEMQWALGNMNFGL